MPKFFGLFFAFLSTAAMASAADPPGLAVTFRSGDGRAVDTTTSPTVALYVEAGKPPTPFVPGGKFSATWEGSVSADLRSEYFFGAELNGTLKVEINGITVLDGAGPRLPLSKAVQLNKGANKFKASFTSPERGDAFVRLSWTEKGTNTSPIPPNVLTHSPTAETHKGAQVRRGRELFLEYRCAKCHTDAAFAKDGVPEVAMDAPSFEGIGARRNYNWMVQWIVDPKAERPSARMPRVLRGPNAKEKAEAVGAYLASLRTGGEIALKEHKHTSGREDGAPVAPLFERLHCVACHIAPDSTETTTNKISLAHVSAKFAPGKLEEFLRAPEAHYQWTRMPNFRLSNVEIEELAKFLMKSAKTETRQAPSDAKLIEQGKAVVESSGCLNCHGTAKDTKASAPALSALAREGWNEGCMAEAPPERAPDYRLSALERADLQAFGKFAGGSLMRHSPMEFAERQTRLLNCNGCHAQPEGFPPLDILGSKLKPEWSGEFIAGAIGYKPRPETHPRGEPWLEARMPGFTAYGKLLAAGLAAQHGYPAKTPTEPPLDQELAKLGQKLVGKEGGFSCVSCHAAGSLTATDVFESEGINLAYSFERLQRDYYYRWMRNPLSIDPQTKMPVYFEEGRSPLTEILDGDAEKQITAIWHYLRLGDKMPAPNTGETQ